MAHGPAAEDHSLTHLWPVICVDCHKTPQLAAKASAFDGPCAAASARVQRFQKGTGCRGYRQVLEVEWSHFSTSCNKGWSPNSPIVCSRGVNSPVRVLCSCIRGPAVPLASPNRYLDRDASRRGRLHGESPAKSPTLWPFSCAKRCATPPNQSRDANPPPAEIGAQTSHPLPRCKGEQLSPTNTLLLPARIAVEVNNWCWFEGYLNKRQQHLFSATMAPDTERARGRSAGWTWTQGRRRMTSARDLSLVLGPFPHPCLNSTVRAHPISTGCLTSFSRFSRSILPQRLTPVGLATFPVAATFPRIRPTDQERITVFMLCLKLSLPSYPWQDDVVPWYHEYHSQVRAQCLLRNALPLPIVLPSSLFVALLSLMYASSADLGGTLNRGFPMLVTGNRTTFICRQLNTLWQQLTNRAERRSRPGVQPALPRSEVQGWCSCALPDCRSDA